jgi:hypothetical protein
MRGTPVGVLVTWSTSPRVKSRQIINANIIMALLTVAMTMLHGVLVRTFFTSSLKHMLESVLHVARKESLYSCGVFHQNLNSVN